MARHADDAASLRDEDVAATLTELTGSTACHALRATMPEVSKLLVCGGGAHSPFLMSRLATLPRPGVVVATSAAAGHSPDRVEALALAWLAQAFFSRRAGSVPAVTGARGPRSLGALYPAY